MFRGMHTPASPVKKGTGYNIRKFCEMQLAAYFKCCMAIWTLTLFSDDAQVWYWFIKFRNKKKI
jgi:hypothetical protein